MLSFIALFFCKVTHLLCLGLHFQKPNTHCLAFVAMVELKEKKPFERLVPKNYRLFLEPNLEKFTFTGEEVIDLKVTKVFVCAILSMSWFSLFRQLSGFSLTKGQCSKR